MQCHRRLPCDRDTERLASGACTFDLVETSRSRGHASSSVSSMRSAAPATVRPTDMRKSRACSDDMNAAACSLPLATNRRPRDTGCCSTCCVAGLGLSHTAVRGSSRARCSDWWIRSSELSCGSSNTKSITIVRCSAAARLTSRSSRFDKASSRSWRRARDRRDGRRDSGNDASSSVHALHREVDNQLRIVDHDRDRHRAPPTVHFVVERSRSGGVEA
jgi:hypothetical protein